MPNWYFSKEDLLRTPSRLDGIDYMTEIRYRREGTRFIMNCGNRMRLYPFASTNATLAFCKGFLCTPSRLRLQKHMLDCSMLYASGDESQFNVFFNIVEILHVDVFVFRVGLCACSICVFGACQMCGWCVLYVCLLYDKLCEQAR